RDEPALRTAVRHHRPSRIRTRPRTGQTTHPHPRHRRHQPAPDRHHRRRRLEGHPADQIPAGQRVLPTRTRPRRLHLRQHLPTLPQLPHRTQLPAHPHRPTPRHRNTRPRHRTTRLDHRNPTPPTPHRPTRHPDRQGPHRMTTTSTLNRVERACTQLHHNGQPITFTAPPAAARTGLARPPPNRTPPPRAVIEQHRPRAATNGTLTAITDDISTLRTALDALATKVRRHEEQLRHLTNRTH